MPKWTIETDATDEDTIQAYAGDRFAYGTDGDMYVAYVVVTTFLNKMKKGVDTDNDQCIVRYISRTTRQHRGTQMKTYQAYVEECKARNVKPLTKDQWLDMICAGVGY